MRTFIVIIVVFSFCCAALSDVIQVPGDQPTIQAGIDAAVGRDTVLVAPGIYVENIDFLGKAITVISEAGAEFTVIDGGRSGSVVSFISGERGSSVLHGFTITNGTGTPDGYTDGGGGIYCRYSSSPTIRNNIIEFNEVEYYGGGIYCKGMSSPRILRNIVRNNSANYGGGIIIWENCVPFISENVITANTASWAGGGISTLSAPPLEIVGNRITHNSAASRGGGIDLSSTAALVMDNTLSHNTANYGGGINCLGDSPEFMNNFFIGNHSVYSGGGIYLSFIDFPVFTSNTFYYNTSDDGGGSLRLADSANVDVCNNVFWFEYPSTGDDILVGGEKWGATLTLSYCDVRGGQSSVYEEYGGTIVWGGGMIDADPEFVDEVNVDLHIRYTSPCRDAGDHLAVPLPELDFEGDPRIAEGLLDMGADEFHTRLYYTGDATPGGSVCGKLLGWPGSAPVGIWFGSGVLEVPIPSMFGAWYLEPPWILLGPLGAMPADGLITVPATVPLFPPGPYALPMQALIGHELTNLCILQVF